MEMMNRLDPHLVAPLSGLLEAFGGNFNIRDIPATRKQVAGMIAAVKAEAPPIEGVDAEDRRVPGHEGDPEVLIRIYRPTEAVTSLPAVLWFHGGGFVLGDIELDDLMCRQLAKDVQSVVVGVEYRLAPENPYPAALHDAYAALRWVAQHAGEIGVDPAHLAVAGASAGANIAAGLTLLARDEGQVHVSFQLLIYPTIDDNTVVQADENKPDALFWTRENHLLSWTAYLGERLGQPNLPAYAAPIRAADLNGLPPTYMAVGDIDLLLEEDLEYARRLIASHVPTELHVYPGAFHAFDAFAPMAPVSQRFLSERNDALRRALKSA
jgi:acetyl esterase/lipase